MSPTLGIMPVLIPSRPGRRVWKNAHKGPLSSRSATRFPRLASSRRGDGWKCHCRARNVDALCSTGKQSCRGKNFQNLKSASRNQKYHSSTSRSSSNVTPTNLDRIVSVAMAPRQMVKGSPRMVGNAAPCSDVRQGNAGQPDTEKVHSMGQRRPPT
jgi:hypothetical protein